MIISRTPVRISFFGGGTDIAEFYSKSYGAVLSTAIKKYVYVAINKKFDKKIRVSYSETETVDSLDQIKHKIIKECLKSRGVDSGIEVVTIADIPGHGTGLGSSSALTVGLLNGLNFYTKRFQTLMDVAEDACDVEIKVLNKPIGKQDQYITAIGGFRYIKFHSDGKVTTEPAGISADTMKELQENLVSFYVSGAREGDEILKDQKNNIKNRVSILEEMRDQAETGLNYLRRGDLASFGRLLDRAWALKSQLSSKISTPDIRKYYETGMKAGALGGKLSGAGGSGFLTFYCEKTRQKALREKFGGLKEMKIRLESEGSRIIYYDHEVE